jgi:hypothetical protein
VHGSRTFADESSFLEKKILFMIVVEKEKSIGGYQKKFFQLSDTEDFLPVI